MKAATYQVDEKQILDKIFTFLVKSGLENISVRELSRGTGIAQGSLYYWFSDKMMIINEATEYGFKKVTAQIFKYVFENILDLEKFFAEVLDEIAKYREELRFIYQMAASPIYGKKIRKENEDFTLMYDKYAEELAKKLNCDMERAKPVVYLFVSAVCDYVIWDAEAKARKEVDFIYSILPFIIGENSKEKVI